MPRALQGIAPALAVSHLSRFGIQGGRSTEMIEASLRSAYSTTPDRIIARTGREAFDAVEILASIDATRSEPANGARYPSTPFGTALRQIGQLVKADVGLEVAFAESGDWDHHVGEGGATGRLANRLDDFARGIAALSIDIGERIDDVVILTMSEFGRAVAENGNGGTDHGHGNVMLILGGKVRGGQVYGRWPGLDRDDLFEQRDLAVTTDFRDVFAEVAVRHLGVTRAETIFPGYAVRESRFVGFLK